MMGSQNQFSCFIIGEGTLPIQCAELLLNRGCTLYGMISSDTLICNWAKDKDIPYIKPTDNLIKILSQKPFDYLFSIVNGFVLPQKILELPRQCAINYHDAPLPRYAGVNATSWALMHQEKTHGITWHTMAVLVDAGDILKQVIIDIDDDETAWTLNGKCYEAAINAFDQLIKELLFDTAIATKQDLDKRTYFSRSQRLSTGGIISWQSCAHQLDALIRALDFGSYPNSLGQAKLIIDNNLFVISKLEVQDRLSEYTPGTITAIEPDYLIVSTASYDLALHQVLTINGQPLSISDLVEQFGLKVGYQFCDIEADRARQIEKFERSIANHEAFWVERLATLELLALPYAKRALAHVNNKLYASARLSVPHEVIAFLKERHPEWNWGDFLEAAFVTYLARINGAGCFDIGLKDVDWQRKLVELQGLFASVIPCRVDIDCRQSFEEVFEGFKKQVGFTKLHRTYAQDVFSRYPTLRSSSELVSEQLFPVIIERMEKLEDYQGESAYKFSFITLLGEQECYWFYNTSVLDGDDIARMQEQFSIFLQDIITEPNQRVTHLPLLSEQEQHKLLVEWNDTEADYPIDKCIHELFEEQVARTPDAVAVVYENQPMTYHELNCRANQLAHYLRALGVSADVLVGICVERSLDMVVGLLGILKAGGAYVPLDPEYPNERLSFMLKDAQVRVLLTQQHLVERLPECTAQLVCLDEVWSQILQNKQDNPTKLTTASDLANVIYTSGSTGKPKGVMVEHRGLYNLAIAQIQAFGLHSDSRVLQFASFSFDACISEILMSFGSGATLYLGTKDSLAPGTPLIERLSDNGITHITLPPSALAVLPPSELPTLQTIIVAGEACSIELMRQWSRERNFFNAYGPTEASVCATIAKCTANDEKVCIGRPIDNVQVYILDQNLQPVPIGVPGELHIGGAGLARGYLNRSDLTQHKFIPNPFEKAGASRLYKTGDLARYLPNGNIEYLGRIDNQVKIRGFRIELGEIEAVLSQHQHVQACCVIARSDTPSDKRLVAYIVPQPQVTPTNSELRQFLKAKLPDYMVPSAFVILESLPLTPNGKIDRRALPTPDLSSQPSDKYVAPRNPIEEILALIWTQVLSVVQVGIHDNFFELGGHSLLATQLVSRIRTTVKVELPLRSLFAAPTVAELAQVIGQLQQQDSKQIAPPIVAVDRNSSLPVSFAQQRLWFLDQLESNSAFYNIPVALRLTGTLGVAALKQSLQEIIARHEALRTNFITVDGKPSQVIHTETTWTLNVVDLQHLSTSEIEIAAQQLAQQQAQTPFDLASESLIRASLVVFSDTEHILIVCMHHIVSDGWSMGVFVLELAALYNAYSIGQSSLRDATRTPLAPLPIQYADFAIWQRQWLQGEVLQSQLDYWRKQLANAPALLSLPTDRPRPPVQTFTGAHIEFVLSGELTAKLTKLSQGQGCTLFMTLLAGFDTLLYRYTGTEDILVGTPIANRDRTQIEGLIGFFVNTLVMRTDVSGNPSFSELLTRVRFMAIDAYAHQNLPFEMLVEALQPERNLSHTPLFQVMFALQNAPRETVELTGLSVSSLPIETTTAKFDLTLAMENTPQGLVGVWEYNTDLFDSSTIERMTGHFVTLLEGIVANPTEHICQLPMLTESEQQQILVEWNSIQADYPIDKCIHQLFEEQVARTPDAVAVVYENQQLTYHELNCRANQLAHYLRALGVSADVLVGICVERSLDMVVGLLGILKAGGAYVPLDPEYPNERLSFMLEDAQVRVLLTQQHLVERLPECTAQLVCLDEVWSQILQNKQDNPTKLTTASDLANVIYTSGSTGQPKGVMVEHRGLYNLAIAQIQIFGLDCDSRVLQFASLSFDACVWEILMSFGSGATLYMGTKDSLAPGTPLIERLSDDGITHITLPPSALAVLPPEELPTLQTIIVAGEACSIELMRQWSAVKNFFNAYGPTEASVCATIAKCTANDEKVCIGRPIDNVQVYILDQYLQPLPIGVPGELHIAGVSLARGYLNRSDLTKEKFIPNPFDSVGDSKLYKTGDLARYLSDGNIEYLGRIDNQVKIRGFRIELGEIEAVLSQHQHVQANCVIARSDIPGNKRLVAYIVPQPEVTPTSKELRKFLKEKLPEYMVPSAFVILESLPLTPNGKIDRRALPKPELYSQQTEKFTAPGNPIEEKLAQIWTQVLRVEQIGIHDNFFELGGDSILSIQIITRAKQAGIELTIKQLFANQTIAELATVAGTTTALSIEQGLVTGTLPLTPIQHWFFEQNLPQKQHFNQSFLLLVPSDLNLEILKQVWQKLLVHHDALRLRFSQTEVIHEQIHAAPTDSIAISSFDLSTVSQTELDSAIEATATSLQASLNLSENLVQVAFFWLGIDKKARLLIVIHHLVVDGVSWRILLEDLQTAYQQSSQGEAIQLPAKTTSFKDWSQKLTEHAQSDVFKSELAYWLNKDYCSISPIPVDYTVGVNTLASASTVSVSLNQAQTLSLLQDVAQAYKTQINDILLTALVLVLSDWTNSSSVLFNLEGHGREEIIDGVDLSRTVGWFTTIFPVCVQRQLTDDLGTILKSVKEQLRTIPNKGIGYGLLRYLSRDPEIAAQLQTIAVAEINFNYLGQFAQVLNTSSMMQLANESSGRTHGLEGERTCLLDINAIIVNEQLQINWTYSSNIHQQQTIENIAQEFVETLDQLIAHCLSPESGGYTPTDFPLIKLTQLELDGVLAKTNWQNIEDIYPLSPMQEGILFESLSAPDSGVYFEQMIWTLPGNLDVSAFEQAWIAVVEKHSLFRTAMEWDSLSQPVQVVLRHVDVKVSTYDWRELSPQQQQAQLETFLDCERQQGFQLEQAPLMRLHLLQFDDHTYQFVWCHHHILLDGWSLPLVFKDLLEFYQAITQGENLVLQPTLSYHKYIAWLQQQDLDLAAELWRQKLQAFSAPTPLTVDKPLSNREQHSSYNSQEIHLTVSATGALVSFARQHQLTLNNLVQATWGLLLSRYSGENDVVFGATVSGRPPELVGVESMVGIFINTLPVRVQISEKTELLGLLKDLQAQQVESEQFSYSSLVEIQGHSDVPRGTSLFESIVVFENYPVDNAILQANDSFSLSNLRVIEQTNYPLTIVAVPGEQLWLKVSYATSRFEYGTISRMLGHFVTLLCGMVANPKQHLAQLPLLSEVERQQLLVEWNNTQADYPIDKCIHQLFEEQVARTPDAIAVVYENEQLTYQQLNCRANQLAHYLRSLGVGPDVLVGICVERSLEMVVGLLGILKAGGAYVPLDPEYPAERLSFMLEDAQVSVLLTQAQLLEKLPQHQAQVVVLDNHALLISQSSQDNPITNVQDSNLAYVIYTSGSTGKPKGAMNTHLGICNRLLWMQQAYQLTAADCILQKTPFSFDVSVWEFFWPLLTGACLVLAQPGGHKDSAYLVNLIQQQQVTTVHFVPSMLQLFLEEQSVKNCRSLKRVICSGEALPKELQERFFACLKCELHNLYGPTEAAIDVTYWQCQPDSNLRTVPIGRPISNTQIYILDSYLQPVPIGVPGELHIGGAGLARGYLNRPDLTQEKFIPNLFNNSKFTQQNSKLYKTGDLARYLNCGTIEYLGRSDDQVKIRGFRIELGEIEAVLSQHSDVQANCVIARSDTPGDKRLVAYLVPQPQVTPTISELRQFLSSKLPDYMVPSAFVILESLPLTPNGKIDRPALPEPELHSQSSDKFIAPRNPIEEILALIWTQVLKLEQVGIHNNFFELGGHSLLATQLVSRIRTTFKVELPLRRLFAAPTIAELAQVIGELQQHSGEQIAPPIAAVDRNGSLPLSFAQQRLWFLDQLESNSAFYNIPVGLRLTGKLEVAALKQSLQEVIVRHEALRTNFITVDGQPTQVIHTKTTWTLDVVDLQHLSTSEIEIAAQQLAQQQAIQPFDLANELLIRARLVVLSDTEHILLVCMHHVVSDGWSMGVFVEELTALYNAYAIGQPSPLAPLAIQYADFALWQRNWLAGDVLQSQLSYWQQQLADAPALLSLPTDRPRPPVQTFCGAHLEFALSVELTQKLTKLSQEQGVTLFMTLLAGFDTLLYRYTGTEDILVGTPIANRDRTQIEGLIGFFVNTLVMRTDVSGNPSFSELLTRVRFMAIDAYAHQNLPFEMLVKALQPERNLSHTPLFQVMFALQNAPRETVELTGLSVSSLPIETTTAKFDLTLAMENTPQGLVGVWEYNTDLFDSSTIERMTGHFVTLLEGIVANPTEHICQLPMLTESEQQQILVEWNSTQADYPIDKCIHQLFEEQVARTPDAVALMYENEQLTYQQLNCRANQLAHYLRSLGVSADVLVGICVERSLDMIVGLLGILKAGGAYVPLDPEYPAERLSFMLEDAQVSVLLTQQHLVQKLPEHTAQLVCLDTDLLKMAQNSQSNPLNTATSNNLAYIIYTSGSTGKPKGVLVNHSNVVRLFAATNSWYNFNSQDVSTLFHSIAFDFSVWEMWGALLHGGRLIVVPYLVTRSPESFLELLCQEKVTILNQTPSAFRQLIQAEQSIVTVGDLNLRLVIFGGEALEPLSLQPWFERHGDHSPQLVNMYGITETTVHVTYRPLSKADLNGTASVIGRPIPDLQVYLLDQHLQPVPIGIPGEMYVGGAGVTCGYLNRSELTEQRFISNPFAKNPKARLYKTGDLARYLPNGELEYLGRIDNQVKIRGFRIELGEIESLLASHPAVWQSVVVVREDKPGDKRLVAYVVPKTEQSPKVEELRQFLTDQLPNYMIPNTFVLLESLPLTSNGKVDYRALPEPELNSQASAQYVAPRTPIEETLAEILAQVLRVEQVGIYDNFFELGGHSLLATQLVSRVRDRFKVQLRLRELFNAPKLVELAESIEKLQQQNLDLDVSPILPRNKR